MIYNLRKRLIMSNIVPNSVFRPTAGSLVCLTFLMLPICVAAERTHNGDTSFTPAGEVSHADWQNPVELERVWQASWIDFPAGYGDGETKTIGTLSVGERLSSTKLPTIVFVHGCAGMLRGERRRVEFFADNGYAVISPISFAREKYPRSCSIFLPKRSLMYRGTLAMRQYDVAYAIQQARKLEWVDENNLFLVGHSEGAILAATFHHSEAGVNARIAESWTCQADWPEYRGVNAPANEPILTLVSKNDPWFRDPPHNGSCDEFLDKLNGSRSIVYENSVTKGKHKVLDYPEVQQDVLAFLNQFRRP